MIKCLLISLSSLLQIVLQESFNIFKLRTVGGIFVPNAPTFVSQTPNNYMNKKKTCYNGLHFILHNGNSR